MSKGVTILIFLCFAFADFGQNYKDTSVFRKEIKKVDELMTDHVDSCKPIILKHLDLSRRQAYAYGYAKTNLQMARFFDLKGLGDSALLYLPEAFKYARVAKDSNLAASALLMKARVLSDQGKYAEAIESALQAQHFANEKKHSKLSIRIHHDLGYMYSNMNLHQKAIEYFRKALKKSFEIKDTFNIANNCARLGGEYNYISQYDSALHYNKESLRNFELIHNLRGVGISLNNLAATYNYTKHFKEAIDLSNRAIAIRKQLGDDYAVTILTNNLALYYLDNKQFDKALKTAKIAEEMNEREGDVSLKIENYANLKNIYRHLGNATEALRYADLYLNLKDTFYYKTNVKAISELQDKYESEKKEQEIKWLQLEKKSTDEKNEAEHKKRNVILLSVISFTLMVIVFASVLYKRFQQSNRQKRIIEEQKKLVDEKQKEIIDSINYALTIQEAMIPAEHEIVSSFPEALVMFRPKDIVSGDFYWHTHEGGYKFVILADCTGHGVPGAFMSLMGISYLSEIINENKITDTAQILDQLRSKVIASLNKTSKSNSKRDGMDMIVLRFDERTSSLQFSGANNDVYLIHSGLMKELKGDKMPVGLHSGEMNSFTSKEIGYLPGTLVFATTDGLPDQFGGPKQKKFMYRRLENILMELHEQPLANMKHVLEKEFTEWKGHLEQVDDVTCIGLRL